MKTIKYTVDRGFRRSGEVRCEEDAVAENLILRGFAEETDEKPDEKTGDAHAVGQYDPQGSEPDDLTHGGVGSLPAELNAPPVAGSNAPAPSRRGSKAASEPASETVPPTETETTSAGEAENAGGKDNAEGHQVTEATEGQ